MEFYPFPWIPAWTCGQSIRVLSSDKNLGENEICDLLYEKRDCSSMKDDQFYYDNVQLAFYKCSTADTPTLHYYFLHTMRQTENSKWSLFSELVLDLYCDSCFQSCL